MIGALARQLETSDGQGLSLPVASAHGAGAWTAENAATTPSDETFAQVVLNAYKATTKVIVSEELAGDAIDAFDAYLADELGRRLGLLEESAFAQGDGTNKPLGLVHASSGIGTVTAATGSSTTFTLADFRAAFAALPAGYQVNASWLMSPSPFLNTAAATDSAGAPRIPSLHSAEPSLFSRPVYISDALPAEPRTPAPSSSATSRRATPSGACAASASRDSSSFTRTRGRSAWCSSPESMVASCSPTRFASSSTRRRGPRSPRPAEEAAPSDSRPGARPTRGGALPLRGHDEVLGEAEADGPSRQVNVVLVSQAHYGLLRRLDPYDAEKMERVLREAFLGPRAA